MLKTVTVAAALVVGFIAYCFIDTFDPGQLKKKRVLITGASTGIGEQLAYEYARNGADVVITARRENKLKEVISKCRQLGNKDGQYFYVTADMSDLSSTAHVVEKAVKYLGGLDWIVLNHVAVSIGYWTGSAANLTSLDKTVDVNFKSYVHLTSAALPHLEKSKGGIAVVSSVAGLIGTNFYTPYSAAKFALGGFFGALRQEMSMKKSPVTVTICYLALIDTDNAMSNIKKAGQGKLPQLIGLSTAADTAQAIVRGATLRYREVFFPYLETKFMFVLRGICPELLDSIMFWIFSQVTAS